jgi:hypothetical protein
VSDNQVNQVILPPPAPQQLRSWWREMAQSWGLVFGIGGMLWAVAGAYFTNERQTQDIANITARQVADISNIRDEAKADRAILATNSILLGRVDAKLDMINERLNKEPRL